MTPSGRQVSSRRRESGELFGPSLPLYDGWMTGWSYEACRHFYFANGGPEALALGDRATLLSWLSTYRNLIDDYGPVDVDETMKELDAMEETVEDADKTPRKVEERATMESFDSHFQEVNGAIRAKAPYAYYAVLFASYASRLRFPRDGDAWPKLVGSMRIFLSNLKSVLPPGAFDVIDGDLEEMKESRPDESDTALKRRIQVWSDLVFGTISVYDSLNKVGTAVLSALLVLAGLAIVLLAGGVIVAVYDVIQSLPGFNSQALSSLSLSNLTPILKNVVPAIASIGVSISLFATRAWDAFQAFDLWVAVKLARLQSLRKRFVYAMIS